MEKLGYFGTIKIQHQGQKALLFLAKPTREYNYKNVFPVVSADRNVALKNKEHWTNTECQGIIEEYLIGKNVKLPDTASKGIETSKIGFESFIQALCKVYEYNGRSETLPCKIWSLQDDGTVRYEFEFECEVK